MRGRSSVIGIRVLHLIALFLFAGAASGAEFKHQQTFVWEETIPHFGGFSGLWVADDAVGFHTVNDQGWYVSGRLKRVDGRIVEVLIDKKGAIHGPDKPVSGDFKGDAEGLAIGTDGTIHISFEAYHRVQQFPGGFEKKPKWLHKWNDFLFLQQNSGLEALAIDAQDVLYAIPERSGAWTRPFPVYRYIGGKWDDSWSIPRSKKFLVVGADFGPDGKFYVLERLFEWYGGFQTRIRRFDMGPNGFDAGETVLETWIGSYGNLEGMSLWTAGDGAIMATLIADDNFNVLQRTTIVEFRLEP